MISCDCEQHQKKSQYEVGHTSLARIIEAEEHDLELPTVATGKEALASSQTGAHSLACSITLNERYKVINKRCLLENYTV